MSASTADDDVQAQEDQQLGRLAATLDRAQRELRTSAAQADTRALLELAKGVLVERLHCGPAQAMRQLRELAARSGRSELEFAADIVNNAARDRIAEATLEFPLAEDAEPVALRLRTAESGILAASDSQAVAESLLTHALAPLGAVGVAIWAAGSDSSLSLAGFAGFTAAEAQRWRYVPPGVGTTARRALTDRHTIWFDTLTGGDPVSIGYRETPGGGRVAVPATAGGRILGVLEICWPHPLPPQPTPIQRQVEALAELCAHTLESRPVELPGLDTRSRPDIAELVALAESMLDSAMVLRPQLDERGQLVDFRIQHTNTAFVDPAGRSRSAVTGALLLEAFPLAAAPNGIFSKVSQVHATGEPFRAEQSVWTVLVDEVPVTMTVGMSISRHNDSVLLVLRMQDEAARMVGLLRHAQRLGRIGGFEENALTGEITWSSQLYTLYGLAQGATPIPLQQLAGYAHPDDADAIGRFLRALLHHRKPASTVFRLRQARRHPAAQPGDRRTGARRGQPAARDPRRLPGCVRPALDRGRAGRDPRPTRPDRTGSGRGQPAGAAVAARDHAHRPGRHRRARPAHRRALPARRERPPGRRRLVRRGRTAVQADPALRRRHRRARHRRGHRHGRAAQRPARPRHHGGRPGAAADLAEPGGAQPFRQGRRDRAVRRSTTRKPRSCAGPAPATCPRCSSATSTRPRCP